MVLNDPKSVAIDVVGSTTKRRYDGIFKIRLLLSHRQKLQKDESKRQLLGTLPDSASVDAMKTAIIYSKCWAHVIDAPGWWKEAGNGLDLLDDEPAGLLYDKIVSMEESLTNTVEKEGEEAKKELTELKNK